MIHTWLSIWQIQAALLTEHCSSLCQETICSSITPGSGITYTIHWCIGSKQCCWLCMYMVVGGGGMEDSHLPLFIRSCSDGRKFSRSARRDHMVDELCRESSHQARHCMERYTITTLYGKVHYQDIAWKGTLSRHCMERYTIKTLYGKVHYQDIVWKGTLSRLNPSRPHVNSANTLSDGPGHNKRLHSQQ